MHSKKQVAGKLAPQVLEALCTEIAREVTNTTVEQYQFDHKRVFLQLILHDHGTTTVSLALSAHRNFPGIFVDQSLSRFRPSAHPPVSALDNLLHAKLDQIFTTQQWVELFFSRDERTRYILILDGSPQPGLFLFACSDRGSAEPIWGIPKSKKLQPLGLCRPAGSQPATIHAVPSTFSVCYHSFDAGPPTPVAVDTDANACPELTTPRLFATANEAVRRFILDGLYRLRYEELKAELQKEIRKQLKKVKRRIRNIQEDLREAEEASRLRQYGDLLLALARDGQRGRSQLVVPSFDGTTQVTIPLDPTKTPVQNAQLYYKKARKLQEQRRVAERRLHEAQAEEQELKSMLQAVEQAPSTKHLQQVSRDIGVSFGGQTRTPPNTGAQQRDAHKKQPRFLLFTSTDGLQILAGKSAEDNEALTFGVAREHDFWFHAAGTMGAHVIVRNPRRLEKCPPRTAEQAASLAAYLSKNRNSSNVLVHFTQKRYLKKAKGGPKGAVVMKTFQSIFVKPALPGKQNPDREN